MDTEARISKIQSDLDELKASLKLPDEQAATPPAPAQRKGVGDLYIAVGAVVISVIVMISFGIMLYVTATMEFPPSQKDNVSGLLWTLNTLAVAVVTYWVGSSSGSAHKTAIMETMKKSRGNCEK